MGLKTIQPKRSIRFHQYNYDAKRKKYQHHQQRAQQKNKNSKNMTIKYDTINCAETKTGSCYYLNRDHNYSITTNITSPSSRTSTVKRRRSKDKVAIHEIGKILFREAECVKTHEKLSRDKFDIECIQSFNEYARYLELVNPICSPEAVDTAEKLMLNLGM